ncbi:hypothetical protein HanRHA438_Chr03g0119801 [Helianthus annuus]|nr:hypothetical protein HanIR_Chr03g0119031 [Helianthus annuus]KAJ0935458.1 hypothetical protein HanRHA438_Chr03g0119801 [Helianthus annuus]
MEENTTALHTSLNSVQALGKGFDVNFDISLNSVQDDSEVVMEIGICVEYG